MFAFLCRVKQALVLRWIFNFLFSFRSSFGRIFLCGIIYVPAPRERGINLYWLLGSETEKLCFSVSLACVAPIKMPVRNENLKNKKILNPFEYFFILVTPDESGQAVLGLGPKAPLRLNRSALPSENKKTLFMTRLGLGPRTHCLKGSCSTN